MNDILNYELHNIFHTINNISFSFSFQLIICFLYGITSVNLPKRHFSIKVEFLLRQPEKSAHAYRLILQLSNTQSSLCNYVQLYINQVTRHFPCESNTERLECESFPESHYRCLMMSSQMSLWSQFLESHHLFSDFICFMSCMHTETADV